MKSFSFHLKLSIGLLASVWIGLGAFFYSTSFEAFSIFLIFPIIFSVPFFIALYKKNISLSIFLFINLLANGLAPAYFYWGKKDYYFWEGYSSIKGFEFDHIDFINIYSHVALFITVLTISALTFSRIIGPPLGTIGNRLKGFKNPLPKGHGSYSLLLFIVIFGIFLPISHFMYTNSIGIVGILTQPMPFKLSGILYYTRFLIFPIFLSIIYVKSKRSLWDVLIVITYAYIVGLHSISRSLPILVFIPLIIFQFIEKKPFRLIACLVLCILSFQIVTEARNYIYMYQPEQAYGLKDEVLWLQENIEPAAVFHYLFENIGTIAYRLGGAHDNVVAAYSSNIADKANLIPYLLGLGPSSLDLPFDLYGLTLRQGFAFGVAISTTATMIMFTYGNPLLLALLAVFWGLYIAITEFVTRKLLKTHSTLGLLGFPLCFLIIYFMNTSEITRSYMLLFLSSLLAFVSAHALKWLNSHRLRGQSNHSSESAPIKMAKT